MRLQLQPGLGGTQGVLRAGLSLTRLELSDCALLDGAEGLAAALMQLPDLQHLSVDNNIYVYIGPRLVFPTDVLSHLVQLTCLLLNGVICRDRNSGSNPDAALQPLQALTRLADLELGPRDHEPHHVPADMLSGADQLTRLVLSEQLFEPRTLAGKSQLQHLTLERCDFVPGPGVAQLLSELQYLTQLTYLDLLECCQWYADQGGASPPLTAYASLTASSKLQHLDLRYCTLPSAAWQYICPPGRTLPQLRYLDIRGVTEADASPAAPDTSALVRCCPGLQSLSSRMPCRTAQLAPLQQLTGLHTLEVGGGNDDHLEGVQALCQLTGLRNLKVWARRAAEAHALQLTQLTCLTAVIFSLGRLHKHLRCCPQGPDSDPVWRQLLQQLLDSKDPKVAQQAAAALEVTA